MSSDTARAALAPPPSEPGSQPGRDGAAAGLFVTLSLIWGSSFLLIAWGLQAFTPGQVVVGRVVAGALTLLVIARVRRLRLPRGAGLWARLALVAVLANLVPFFLISWGERRVPSGLAGVYNAATPLFAMLFAIPLLGERPTRRRLAGLLGGLAGVVVVLSPWRAGPGGGSLVAQLAIIAAAAAYGIALVLQRRLLSGRGQPLPLAAGQILSAALLGIAFVPLWAGPVPRADARAWVGVLLLGALGTGVAYVILYALIDRLGPTSASTVTYVIPVVAVALGVTVNHEHPTWVELAGAVLVVASIAYGEGLLRAGRTRLWPRRGTG